MGRNKGHVPIRTCVSCGTKRPKGELVRLKLDADGRIVRDTSGSGGGRGAYVCRNGRCTEALRRGRLARVFRLKGAADLQFQ